MKLNGYKHIAYSLVVSGLLLIGLILLLNSVPKTARAADELHVCSSGCTYSSIQAAVDAANPDDVIKVAQGTYTDIHVRDSITQIVYISKTITLRGGYTAVNWDTSNPTAHPTTLDAQGLGRVMVISGTIAPVIEGLRITGGDATGLSGSYLSDVGGGIYIKSANPFISGNAIYSNTAGSDFTYGGGLFVEKGNTVLSNNLIYSNTSSNRGGGIYVDSATTFTLDSNTIYNNSGASRGGGVCIFWSNTTFNNNIIHNNYATLGGGLYLMVYNANLSGNLFYNNFAGRGGGLYAEISKSIVMTNNVVMANEANAQGNGLWIGGIQDWDTAVGQLRHTTIVNNVGNSDQGVFLGENAILTFTNNIIAGHTVGITVTAGSTATLDTTLWHANTGTNWGGTGEITHINNHTGDPAFDADGYHLTAASAAVDQGVNAGVTIDMDNDPRPVGASYDIGADEFGAQRVYLPVIVK